MVGDGRGEALAIQRVLDAAGEEVRLYWFSAERAHKEEGIPPALHPRRRLRAHGISERWSTLRAILAGQCRVTATFRRADGRTLHVRKATRAEPAQLSIIPALGSDPSPGGIQKMIV